MLTRPVLEHSEEGARLRPVGLVSVLPAIEFFAQSSDLGNIPSSPLMETFAQPRDCTKKSPLPRWRPLHNLENAPRNPLSPTWERVRMRGIRQVMQSPPRWDRFEVWACPESLEGAIDANALKLCFTLAGSLVPPGRPLMGAEPHLARSGARLD